MSTDYGRAIWKPADDHNYSPASWREGKDIDRLIVHKIEGSGTSAVNTFQAKNSQRSCQYVVDYDGTVYQCVRERDVAWQAGHWPYNQRSIGIEHAGYDEKADVTEHEYHASARLAAHICQRFNVPIDRKHIIGHNEVPGCPNSGAGGFNCHTCPGDHWDWRRYMRLIREYAS